MPIFSVERIDEKKPELFIGLVAAVGTPLGNICRKITDEFRRRGYSCKEFRLSQFLEGYELPTPLPESPASNYEETKIKMDRGNELRNMCGGGDALALITAANIYDMRPTEEPRIMPGQAFLLNQLKHPDEAYCFRKIYGASFHLIGVYCQESIRLQHLKNRGMDEREARDLITRDEEEIDPLGQHLRDTFYLADVFVEAGLGGNADGKLEEQLRRYFKLLFGEEIVTPTPDECGMHLAYSASLRSSDLSRQVGAAVLNPENEVISLGTNEVPSPEGGQYWGDVESDYRDFKKGYDSNARMKIDVLKEILEVVDEHYKGLSSAEKGSYIDSMVERLGQTRLMNLTEFGRSVHAEMEAIICAGRNGVPVRGSTLYTTTFPCHNCAKHIINAGIKRVVYIEPYPKSLAKELHDDAMTVCESDSDDIKVRFEPFVGIGPRIYRTMFSILQFDGSRVKRKEKSGNISTSPHGLRNTLVHCTYLDLESAAAIQAKDMAPNESERKDENGSNNSSA